MAEPQLDIEVISVDETSGLFDAHFEIATASDLDHYGRLGDEYVRRGPLPTTRQVLGGMIFLLLFVLAAKLSGQEQPAAVRTAPVRWLENRPLTEPLSPFMAVQCRQENCRSVPVSDTDVRRIRAGLSAGFTVTAHRVLDRHADPRGFEVDIGDVQGDDLTVAAVQVAEAPPDWDGASANLLSDNPTSRWVVRSRSGVWLVESRARRGACGADSRNYLTLYERALARVRAGQLGL